MTTAEADRPIELERVLRGIQNETLEEVRAREADAFDRLAAPFADQLVLFGAGPLGKGTLAGLRQTGIQPLAFADNNSQLWGKQINGLKVLSPEDAVGQYGGSACFVVTIYNGSPVRKQLADLGCRCVTPVPPLFWKYSQVFTPNRGIDVPHRLREHIEKIRDCHRILQDDISRRELLEQVKWRYWLDYAALSSPFSPKHTYFPFELLSPLASDAFVDCGSFDGDTIRSFSTHWEGKFRHAYAFEPDPVNRDALALSIGEMGLNDRVSIMPYAVGSESGAASFNCTSSAGSHLATGGQESTVECRRLDDIEWPIAPTYIKMDIESAEPEALAGARNVLTRHKPVLAVCTYHRSSHLWEIPNLIHSINPEYQIFLRRYAEECWEGVCYAIPPSRLRVA